MDKHNEIYIKTQGSLHTRNTEENQRIVIKEISLKNFVCISCAFRCLNTRFLSLKDRL